MGAAVVDLGAVRAERQPHLSGRAQCVGCKHEWQAVAPIGTETLECPACGLRKGMFANPVMVGTHVWECHCGNDLFRISGGGEVYCVNCGDTQEGWF